MEHWRDIVGYEGYYQVSDMGRIKSLDRVVIDKRGFEKRIHERIMKQEVCHSYFTVHFRKNCTDKRFFVHRLVASCFLDDYKQDLEVNHIDGNKLNNVIENLEIVTKIENIRHAIRTGLLKQYGEDSVKSKFSNAQADIIRTEYQNGAMQEELANKYGVAISTIGKIIRYESYNHNCDNKIFKRKIKRRRAGGCLHNASILSNCQIEEIFRLRYKELLSYKAISIKIGVSETTVGNLIRGVCYKEEGKIQHQIYK